jgi:hypothetical protein
MARRSTRPPQPVIAREPIYAATVRRHVLAILSEVQAFARDHPDRLRHQGRVADLERDEYSPLGLIEHRLAQAFLAAEPQRVYMHQWVQTGVMHHIGTIGARMTGFKALVIPFLMSQSLGKGIGYLTRPLTTPEELEAVVTVAIQKIEAADEDCIFALQLNKPYPAFWLPERWPKDAKIVDIEPER